jgi:hypothetical protein
VQIYRLPPEPNIVSRVANLTEHLLFGLGIFFATARILDSSELSLAIDLLLRRHPPADMVAL